MPNESLLVTLGFAFSLATSKLVAGIILRSFLVILIVVACGAPFLEVLELYVHGSDFPGQDVELLLLCLERTRSTTSLLLGATLPQALAFVGDCPLISLREIMPVTKITSMDFSIGTLDPALWRWA